MIISLDSGGIEEKKYWRFVSPGSTSNSSKDLVEEFRALFFDSVRIRLRSDVKVGVLLSGGLDSSAITTAVKQVCEEQLQTYSIVSEHEGYDERRFIDVMCKAGVPNRKVTFRVGNVLDCLEQVLYYSDEPFAGFSVIAQHQLFAAIKHDSDVTVLLSGQGGDETLLGYLKFFFFHVQLLLKAGKYLNAMSATYVQFCIEKELATSREDRLLDGLTFEKFPASHLLPSNQIPKLKHASSFINDEVIKSTGLQFPDAKSVLQLGDLIVEKPKNWNTVRQIAPEDMPVFVVISQACDIAQGNSDAVLLLRGTIRKRDWTAALRNIPETTDVFLHNGEQYQIEWQKARIAAWSATLVDQRLKKNGGYLRIGRFREVEALKLQNIFATNLTRVGTIAAPHPHTDVGISFTAPTKDGQFTEIFKFTLVQRMAAVIWAKPPTGKPYQLLVFNSGIAERIVANVEGLDLSVLKEPFAKQIKSIAESPEMLASFKSEIKLGKELDFGSGLKVEIRWAQKVLDNGKDVRKSKFVIALSTTEDGGG